MELPVLDNEIYHAVKPGLSSYKNNPEEVCTSVNAVTYAWVSWLLDHQIPWDFLWVGFMRFKPRVITEIPPADAVIPPRSSALCLPDLHACQR